jgi:molybdate transport system substrate-binding protein
VHPDQSTSHPPLRSKSNPLRFGRWAAITVTLALTLSWSILGTHGVIRAETPTRAKPLVVFAAASLTDVLQDVSNAFTAETAIEVRHVFAASSTLARQIENGARADIFLSADQAWMDYLQSRSRIDERTRIDLFSNRLVIIAPRTRANTRTNLAPPTVRQAPDLRTILRALDDPRARLTLADPRAVPLGRYSQSALESLDLWERLRLRIALADNARSALLLVARGESPLGIVYATDAATDARVQVLARLSPNLYPKITYPAAAVRDSVSAKDPSTRTNNSAATQVYLEFLQSDTAAKIFRRAGFRPLSDSESATP